MISRKNLSLLERHTNSFWLDCLVYSRNVPLPSALFPDQVLNSDQVRPAMQAMVDGQFTFATEHCQEIINSAAPQNLKLAAYLLGAISLGLDRKHQEAAAIFSRFIESNPAVCQFRYYLALCQLKLGLHLKAIDNLEQSVQLDPNFVYGWGAIGLVSALMRDHQTTAYSCRKALDGGYEIGNQLLSLCQFQADVERGLTAKTNHFDSKLFEPVSPNEHEELLGRFPAVERPYQSEGFGASRLLLYCAADNEYFKRHVVPLVWSLIETGSECDLHIHVFNPDSTIEGRITLLEKKSSKLRLCYTLENIKTETIAAPNVYYSCMRFARFFEATRTHPGTAIMLDADALFRKPVSELLDYLKNQPRPVLARVAGEPIWQEVSAAFLAVSNEGTSRSFLSQVSSSIMRHLLQGDSRWFLDQVALYMATKTLHATTTPGDVAAGLVCDINQSDSSFIWMVTNDKNAEKFANYIKHLAGKYETDSSSRADSGFNITCAGRYGQIIVNRHDQYIGRSLASIGVWCQHELDLLERFLTRGSIVVEGGANYGSHTLAFAQFVGRGGEVHAFEPQRLVYQALSGSVALNSLQNVYTYMAALGSTQGDIEVPVLCFDQAGNFGGLSLADSNAGQQELRRETVPVRTVDELRLRGCTLIKADVEGMEIEVIRGAAKTIELFRPVLYLECHDDHHRQPLIDYCSLLGYQLYWHGTKFDPNILGIPKEREITVHGLALVE